MNKAKKVTTIAIPSMSDTGLESDLCAHFGSCEHFTIVDVRDKAITGVRTISNRAPYGEHNCAAPLRILKSQNVEILLVLGHRRKTANVAG